MMEEKNVVIVEKRRPTYSIIVPTWEDYEGLSRTLGHLVLQRFDSSMGPPCEREVLVVGDGFEEGAKNACIWAKKMADKFAPQCRIGYAHLKGHSGTGNAPRAAGLKVAKNDWVLFIDAGTSVCVDALDTITKGIEEHPDARIVTWDMVQLLDPVPITTSVFALNRLDRSKGLPYVLPGCATAVRRDLAQSVDWPLTGPSDWAYTSRIWEKAFGLPEDTAMSERETIMIPWVLTVSYGARTKRKVRWPTSSEEFINSGYTQGYDSATTELVAAPPEESSVEVVAPTADDIMTYGDADADAVLAASFEHPDANPASLVGSTPGTTNAS